VPFPLAPHALHPSTQSNASTSVFSSGYITPADEIASSAFQSSRASTPIVVFDPAVDDDVFASDLPSLHAGMQAVLERLVQIRSGCASFAAQICFASWFIIFLNFELTGTDPAMFRCFLHRPQFHSSRWTRLRWRRQQPHCEAHIR
jgi:hypothetical protein